VGPNRAVGEMTHLLRESLSAQGPRQSKFHTQHHHARHIRRISFEYDVPHPSVPDFGKVPAIFASHHNQASMFLEQERGAVQTCAVHEDHTRHGWVRFSDQVDQMGAILG